MRLFLSPVDVWLFRDGRPFSAGSDHRAESLFPPPPSVVQGALRSHHLVIKGVPLHDRERVAEVVGTTTSFPAGFRIRGPFVAREEKEEADSTTSMHRYFPLPEDACNVSGREDVFRAVAPVTKNGILTRCPTPRLLLESGEPRKREGEWWLREDQMANYLKGQDVTAQRADTLYVRELRPGISLDAGRRTTSEGMLFEAEYIRPRDGVGLEVRVDGLDGWPDSGVLRLGGESRAARFLQLPPAPPAPAPAPLPERFKLCFATPTYFERGWQPADWTTFFEGEADCVAAAVGRYRSIGGFDMAGSVGTEGVHKPARRYVPSGSVYFFESKGHSRLRTDFVCDDSAPIGWGQVIVGTW
jgi:CRISPR-associated protein Cmr3